MEREPARNGPFHRHRHLPALDARPDQPDDQAAAGAHRPVLEERRRSRGFAHQMPGGGHPGVRRKDSRAGEGAESDVFPIRLQRGSDERQNLLLFDLQQKQVTDRIAIS